MPTADWKRDWKRDMFERAILRDEVVGDFRRACYRVSEGGEHHQYHHWWWVLIGPRGAVQFSYMKSPPHPIFQRLTKTPGYLGTDVGRHSYKPEYEDQTKMDCDLLVGQDFCYYDGSSLRAEYWLEAWAQHDFDEAWLWQTLHLEYREQFD